MPQLTANGITLEYDTFGDPADPALLLVMGLGAQMTAWDPGLCQLLVDKGFHVIRFDNRDAGLSQSFDDHPVDAAAVMAGDASSAPYKLADMADDAAALLAELGIDRAHVVGASMGGMIVQELLIRHPDRLLSACSIMSTTGDTTVGASTPEAMAALQAPPPQTAEEAGEAAVRASRVIGSTGFPFDEERVRAAGKASFERARRPMGFVRQFAAIIASGDRTEGLRSVTVPTLVIHGEADPLLNVSGGKATAAAIPNSRLLVIPGMGHDLPAPAWPQIVDAIADNAARAGSSATV
ncbi:alpha/beta fold hydrolase [Kutzneria kofuensis]|uniref:Pimeloyl-ACP methyl ester carboxylesterase n=1 Tax=Kutzneria kofuensis TaxID=103725 RepID=A0A7W9KH89_9PSEU|nr:alpha/beta hydrolase [Kutzneria kofuensis]MBB5892541.1 pimeloyl-ACP methyl ester carboxylesterase [Kutzneria kofuensis]